MNKVKYHKLEKIDGGIASVGLDYFEQGIRVSVFVMLSDNKTLVSIIPMGVEGQVKSMDETINESIAKIRDVYSDFSPQANSFPITQEEYYSIIDSYGIREDYDSTLKSKLPNDVLMHL